MLESIALRLNLPLIGGIGKGKDSFEAAYILKPYLELIWHKEMNKRFFFHAEDFSAFLHLVENEKAKIKNDLNELKVSVDKSHHRAIR